MNFEEYLSEAANMDHVHADKLRLAANKYNATGMQFAENAKEKKVYAEDHAAMHEIADHIYKGEHKQALSKIGKIDTYVRDHIPVSTILHVQARIPK